MFQVIPGIPGDVYIISPFRFPEYAGIDMGLGGNYCGILVLQGRVYLLEQGYGYGVHEPSEFRIPQVSLADQVQGPEQGGEGAILDQGEDLSGNAPGGGRGRLAVRSGGSRA
jgi:hypothetical protein